MRILITGATGFVGRYLVRRLCSRGHEVYGTCLRRTSLLGCSTNIDLTACDIRNRKKVQSLLARIRPHLIFHLAAQSSVTRSLRSLRQVMETNFWGTYHLLESACQIVPTSRLLIVASGDCYGQQPLKGLPVTESSCLNPQNPYAISKAAADMLSYYYHRKFALNVVRARPFNHTGPGQSPHFVCSDFARQVAAIDLGLRAPVLQVGNLDVQRDFTDVRDVVRAYEQLMRHGKQGEAYNIASERPVSLRKIVQGLLSFSHRPIRVSVETHRLRVGEPLVHYGSNGKIRRLTGWRPVYPLRRTLRSLYLYWKCRLQGRGG